MATDADIDQGLTEVFHDASGDETPTLAPELSAGRVKGRDSIRTINIIPGVEERLGVKLRSREVDQLRNVGDLVCPLHAGLG